MIYDLEAYRKVTEMFGPDVKCIGTKQIGPNATPEEKREAARQIIEEHKVKNNG